jgi:hypothetical protein
LENLHLATPVFLTFIVRIGHAQPEAAAAAKTDRSRGWNETRKAAEGFVNKGWFQIITLPPVWRGMWRGLFVWIFFKDSSILCQEAPPFRRLWGNVGRAAAKGGSSRLDIVTGKHRKWACKISTNGQAFSPGVGATRAALRPGAIATGF